MKLSILLSLLFSFSIFAQETDPLKAEREELAQQKKDNETWEKEQLKFKSSAEQDLKQHQLELDHIQDLVINNSKNVSVVATEVKQALANLPALKRIGSRKAAFYRCLGQDLESKGFIVISTCKDLHHANFSEEEEEQFKNWSLLVSSSESDLRFGLERVKRKLENSQKQIETANKQLSSVDYMKIKLKEKEDKLQEKVLELELIKKYSNFVDCNDSTPAVSLEEMVPFPGAKFKGPFVGVPRDNQDGLGTCYANTAKNLLVGLSKGEDIASFLDLALIYKETGPMTDAEILDGGSSCGVLNRISQRGYCPQSFAPFETGEKNIYNQGFFGKESGTIYDQARLLRTFEKFLSSKEKFMKSDKSLSSKVLSQASFIIESIKSRSDIVLPLPVVRVEIPNEWKLKEAFVWQVKNKMGTSEEKFMEDYHHEYKKFYPSYVKAVMEGKDGNQIFDLFKDKMKVFLEKYKLDDQMPFWKTLYMKDVASDFSNPNLKKTVQESLRFLKYLSGKENENDDTFIESCVPEGEGFLDFLVNLDDLIKVLKNKNANTDLLVDKNGFFRPTTELMQLLIAPSCLSSEKRKKIDYQIDCGQSYGFINLLKNSGKPIEEQRKKFRERIVASLVQGFPLGNSFNHHINTIVGLRFNKETRSCELLIRESQTGLSTWQNESTIFDQIGGLTEVRRK